VRGSGRGVEKGERSMRLYQDGDRSAGICETCRSRVTTRMTYRDYTPTGWDVTVPDVLVAVCDRCGEVVGVPHQSTPKINEYRKEKDSAREGVEARVPRAIAEALELVTASLGGEPRLVRPAVIRYYLNLVARDPGVAEAVKLGSMKRLATGRADRRLAVKVLRRHWEPAWSAAKAAGITNKGQLLRGVAVLAADDFQISTDSSDDRIAPKVTRAARSRNEFLRTLAKTV
jgi:hypothetical protein